MKICFALSLPTILLASASFAQKDIDKKAEAKLQGTWKVVALEAGGQKVPKNAIEKAQILIKDKKISLSGEARDLRPYRLDFTVKPKAIDIPGGAEKEFSKGIFDLDGDTLRLCFSQSTKLDRPKDFNTAQTMYLCFTLKRDRP